MQREEFIVSCTKAEWEGCEKALRVRSWVRRLWEGTDRCRINSRQWDICNLNSYSSYRPRIVAVTAVLPAVLLAHAPFQPTLPLSPRSLSAHTSGLWSQLLAKSHAFFQILSLCPGREALQSPLNTVLCDNLPSEELGQQCFGLSQMKEGKAFISTRHIFSFLFSHLSGIIWSICGGAGNLIIACFSNTVNWC